MGFQKSIFITISVVIGILHIAKGQSITADDEKKIRINCTAINGNNLFAGTDNGVYLSTDSGEKWSPINDGLPEKSYIKKMVTSGTSIFAKLSNYTWFISSNNGTNWKAANVGLADTKIDAVALFRNKFFAATNKGLFISADNGLSWAAIPEMAKEVNSIVTNENYIIAYSEQNYDSSVDGIKWQAVKDVWGRPELVAEGDNIYALECRWVIDNVCYTNVLQILSKNGKKWEDISLSPRYFGFYHNNIYAILAQFKELKNMNFSCTVTVVVSENRGKKWTKINEATDPFLLSDLKIQKKLKEVRDGVPGEIDFAKRNATSLARLKQAAREEKARNGSYPCGDPFYIPLQTTSHNYGQKSNDRFQEMNNHSNSYIDSNGGIHIK